MVYRRIKTAKPTHCKYRAKNEKITTTRGKVFSSVFVRVRELRHFFGECKNEIWAAVGLMGGGEIRNNKIKIGKSQKFKTPGG